MRLGPLGPGAESGRELDGDDLRVASFLGVVSAQSWPQLAAGLIQAQQGDGSILRTFADRYYGGGFQGFDVSLATLALDQRYPRRVGPFLEAGRHAARLFPHFGIWNNGYNELPFGLVRARRGDSYFGPFRHSAKSPPALVVGGTRANTPYVWAKRLTADLGNAEAVDLPRRGARPAHPAQPVPWSATCWPTWCDGVLPPEGASCEGEPPFGSG